MKGIFILLFSSIISMSNGQDMFFMLNAQGATGPQISSVNVKYNTSTYSYITNKTGFGYSDLDGPFATGSNVIDVADMTGTNTGLSYDPLTDRFIVRASGNYFMTREAFTAAATLGAGNEPAHDEDITLAGSSGQGLSIDPINREFYSQDPGDESFTRRNYAGTVLETIDFSSLGPELSFNSYDYGSKTVYLSSDGELVYGYKKVNGTWTHTFTSYYDANEGSCIDYLTGGKMVYNGGISSQNPTGTIREQHYTDGKDIAEYPYPMTSMSGVVEGFTVDQADGTFWINSDQCFPLHGNITFGCRLWHTDPRGWYKKFYRSPHMDRFSEVWQLSGGNIITGVFGTEAIKGVGFSIGPVIDYGAFTGQQTLGNWTFGEGENGEIEFRGSGTAPTTTPETTREYHDLVIYDANGTNDGWGSTTPGSWQSTPTTDRYMQVRVKPLAPAPSSDWTPYDLGDTLIAWYTGEKTTKYDLTQQWQAAGVRFWDADGNEGSRMYNLVDPGSVNGISYFSAGFYPLWDNTNHWWAMTGGNRHWTASGYSYMSTILASGDFEFTMVAQRSSAGARAVFMGICNTGTNVNRYAFMHNSSSNSPASYLHIEHTDGAGTVTRHGVTDTNAGTNRMLSFRVGVNPNKIFINKVEQTLTDQAGTNTGQGPDLVWGAADTMRWGRLQSSSSVTGTQRMGDIFITTHLSVWARAKLYTYLQSIGQLP
ncbi:MAG TPA: hypothetical protein VK589_21305 [Chryseolinea sp.]|nr:hypothetical protein [Chryseolinea sp.]